MSAGSSLAGRQERLVLRRTSSLARPGPCFVILDSWVSLSFRPLICVGTDDQPCKVVGRTLGEMSTSCGAPRSCPEDGDQRNGHYSCHKVMQTHCWGEGLGPSVSGKSIANVQKLLPSFGSAISLPCIYLKGTVKVYTENCG